MLTHDRCNLFSVGKWKVVYNRCSLTDQYFPSSSVVTREKLNMKLIIAECIVFVYQILKKAKQLNWLDQYKCLSRTYLLCDVQENPGQGGWEMSAVGASIFCLWLFCSSVYCSRGTNEES